MRRPLFALVGDVAKRFWEQLRPHVAPLIPLLIENINPYYVAQCNNAAWSIGEIAMKAGADMEPFVAATMERIVPMLVEGAHSGRYHRSLLENGAITLGRLGVGCPATVAAHTEEMLQGWCTALRNVRDGTEKEHAFLGCPGPDGAFKRPAFPTVNRFSMAPLYGRAGRLTAKNGGFWHGQSWWCCRRTHRRLFRPSGGSARHSVAGTGTI